MTGLPCKIVKPGVVDFQGNGFNLQIQMKYNPTLLDVYIEIITIDDRRLIGVLGEKISRVVYGLKDTNLSGSISFEITEIKNNISAMLSDK